MAFGHTGVGDAGELGLMEGIDVFRSAIAHSGTQTAEHLIDNLVERTLVRHTGGNPFRHKFLRVSLTGLEIAVFRAFLHGFERTHATV